MMNNNNSTNNDAIHVKNMDGLCYLNTYIKDNSIDLILTDPPYIISKDTGMNRHYNKIQKNIQNGVKYVKTEKEWIQYKQKNDIVDDKYKDKYMKYGTIYGQKYCIRTHYGDWDVNFTLELLEKYIAQYYKKLKKGGTVIIFFDVWKITPLKLLLEKYKFKQIRLIEWIKTNPQPRNSRFNYLTNCREIALTAVKKSKPIFNSYQDNGLYFFPLQTTNRNHCAQKNEELFEELIKKHSNENDVVLDTFLGSGTTLIACKNTNRQFRGCEISAKYFETIKTFI